MDQPTDPLTRQLALTALTTEHFNLQTARMGTIAEANGRSTLYLGALSSATIAIAFVGQAVERKGLPILLRAFEALREHVPAEEMIRTEDIAEAVRFVLATSPNCVIPEIVFQRPGETL